MEGHGVQSESSRDVTMILPVMKRQEPRSDDVVVLPPELELISEPITDEVNVFYAFDFPGYFEYVSRQDCKALGINSCDLRELSVRNLTKRRGKPEVLKPSDTAVMLRLDGDLEASLLLVSHLWPQLARGLPGEIVVAIPSRDVLVASGTGAANGVETLRRAVRRRWDSSSASSKLLLTRSLLVWRAGSWHGYEA